MDSAPLIENEFGMAYCMPPGGFVPPPMPAYPLPLPVPGGFVPPPMPAHPVPQPQPAPTPQQWNIPSISQDTAREAFTQFASDHCCYSNSPAKDGVITNMEPFNTYRFRLETFTEERSTAWGHAPYKGQRVDANIQSPPLPWAVAAKTPTFFINDKQVIKMPNTSSVINCNDVQCLGVGKKQCKPCAGAGNKKCVVCNGRGTKVVQGTSEAARRARPRCTHCSGSGKQSCTQCRGQGSKDCDTCGGKRQLLVFINLIVTWKNNKDEYVVRSPSGLEEKLSEVSGQQMFRDTQCMVYPVMGFPEPQVVSAAQRLVNEHQEKFSKTGRILQQRQTIELMPITKVTYNWEDSSHEYYVYGNECQVSADSYPDKCCCCTVM